MVKELDQHLDHFSRIVERDLGIAIAQLKGAGAAGGLGGGLVAFAGGRLKRGIELVIEAVGLERRLKNADLCLTGEGSLDHSSGFGKTAVGVARLARGLGCPTIALAGSIGPGALATLELGLAAYFSICPGPISLVEAINRASELLEQTTRQVVAAFVAGRRVET
jgi:glycerate kinase